MEKEPVKFSRDEELLEVLRRIDNKLAAIQNAIASPVGATVYYDL